MNCIDKWLLFNMGFIKQGARIDRIRSLKALIKAILWYYYFLCNLSLYPQCPVLNGSMNRLDCDLTSTITSISIKLNTQTLKRSLSRIMAYVFPYILSP